MTKPTARVMPARTQIRGAGRSLSALLFVTAMAAGASAQTLFTYGDHAVSKAEFLKAYNKNNGDSGNPKISYASYLDLYTKFRMKVQAAHDEHLDTAAQQLSEVHAFHDQLAESFLQEDASMQLLVNEAARRSLKDIHLADLYIPIAPESTQEQISASQTRIQAAYERLTKGEPFEKVAADYTIADLGYITAFVLPYDIENIAYTTPQGGYAKPYRASHGFHIFHPMGERKAVGKIRVAQILLGYPPGADAQAKNEVGRRADSVYRALRAGASFSSLALRLSRDNLSYQTGGELPVFGVGKYDPVFERAAFDLANDSDISKPFATSFGYHILMRIRRIPVIENPDNKEWRATIKERVEQSDRMNVAQAMLLVHVRKIIKNDAPPGTQTDDTAALAYYRDHLEKYNAEFAGQLQEFSEGNLLFTIMQSKVWGAASADSAALMKFYENHNSKYRWENSADALIITCHNKADAQEARNSVKINFHFWKKWADNSNGLIQADSGRYELSQIPVRERTNFTEGLVTASVENTQDSSITFAYIIKMHGNSELKKFEDAKGAVINDYQAYLENKWVESLKQKYPVKINRKVLNSLPKN